MLSENCTMQLQIYKVAHKLYLQSKAYRTVMINIVIPKKIFNVFCRLLKVYSLEDQIDLIRTNEEWFTNFVCVVHVLQKN